MNIVFKVNKSSNLWSRDMMQKNTLSKDINNVTCNILSSYKCK